MESKSLWLSKTFWTNAVALAVSIATAFGLDLGLDPEQQAELVAVILSLANIGLRLVTRQPVTVLPPPAPAP